jgi:hypothetical protein
LFVEDANSSASNIRFTVFAHLHGAKYNFFILENRVISILEATELMPFREMFFFSSFNHMKQQINCVGAQGALGPAVSCEKSSFISSSATLELSFSSTIIFPLPELEN